MTPHLECFIDLNRGKNRHSLYLLQKALSLFIPVSFMMMPMTFRQLLIYEFLDRQFSLPVRNVIIKMMNLIESIS